MCIVEWNKAVKARPMILPTKTELQSESCTSLELATWQCGQCKYSEYFQEPCGLQVGQQKFAVNSLADI